MIDTVRMKDIFEDSLADVKDGSTIVEGILNSYAFLPEKLDEYKEEIVEMLGELPVEFRKSGGGGWSFLNACMDKDGNQWTDFHLTMEMLICLGMGVGYVTCPLPREIWDALPGGMPYYVIDL